MGAIRDTSVFLEEAKASLVQMKTLEARSASLEVDVHNLEKQLAEEKKSRDEAIDKTIKARRHELSAGYDDEIAKTRSQIKQEEIRRQKAIAHGKKARSRQETSGLSNDNRELKKQMKELFRSERMPAFCNSTFYYSLFGPGSFKEVIILIITLLVILGVIPFGIYFLVPEKLRTTIFLVLVYVVVILVFGLLYVLIHKQTKGKHYRTFREGKAIRKQIRKNLKDAARIEKSITKEKDESHYDLSEYDSNLEKLKGDLDEIMARRTDAMANFEQVTVDVITNQIYDSTAEGINNLEDRLERTKYRRSETLDEARRASLHYNDTYGPYIDRANWNEQALDAMIAMVNSGEAASVMEAQTLLRSRR